MVKQFPGRYLAMVLAASFGLGGQLSTVQAQEPLPWQSERSADQRYDGQQGQYRNKYNSARQPTYNNRHVQERAPEYENAQRHSAPDPYRPNSQDSRDRSNSQARRYDYGQSSKAYTRSTETRRAPDYPQNGRARAETRPAPRYVQPYRPPQQTYPRRYGANQQYRPGYDRGAPRYDDSERGRYRERSTRMPDAGNGTYSQNEVVDAGHRFFGSLSNGLAKAIQWAFKNSGRPNGYILGEDAGGAFVAGLRYGEGKLYTKNYGVRRIFWQGPSIGYDFGGDGNRTMTLVYNLRSPRDVYRRFGGVQGSAYLVGGASVQLLTGGDITLAPIRTGVGLRLGANIGYLKYTRRPTWNPF